MQSNVPVSSTTSPAAGMSFLGGSFDFSAFQGSSGNGSQGGLSPVNQPDPNYVNYDFSAFDGNATNGGQGGLAPLSQATAPSVLMSSGMMGAMTGNSPPLV